MSTPTSTSPSPGARSRLSAALVWLGLSAVAQAQAQAHPEPTPAGPAPARQEASVEANDASGPTLAWSGFGTLGWAQSNRAWAYQRFVDQRGGFERDSLLGAQLDLQLNSEWSATVQARLAPSSRSDTSWQLRPSWAFLAWRPDNDWLLRVGRLRLPAYLRSEQLDVGATFAQARLPAEVYGVLPSEDIDSINLTRNWSAGSGELSLDLYSGRSKQTMRSWAREGMDGALATGANFLQMTTEAHGLVLTWNGIDTKARLGVHRVVVTPPASIVVPVRPTWVALGPGFGYWQTHPAVPGPGMETVDRITSHYLAGGIEFRPLPGWTVTAEANRVRPVGTERSIDTRGAYVSLMRQFDQWSPYLTLGRLQSSAQSLAWARTLDETSVPAFVPGSELLNGSMRAAADTVPVYDQRSWAVGSAYSISPTQKLKAEWLHTRAKVSSMFDLPSGATLNQPRSLDVLSINYSFTF